jgi:hypothetical protein
MTQAFNLSQFANNLNTSGQASLTSSVTGTLPVGNGGTGAATLTANSILVGAGTSAVTFVAPSSNGNVLTSNGTNWFSGAPPVSGVGAQVFTTSGTWTKPAGVTKCIVTVIGAGGHGDTSGISAPARGGSGGYVKAYITGLTGDVAVTVGLGINLAAGNPSSFGSFATATGGARASGTTPGVNGGGSTTGTLLRSGSFGMSIDGTVGSNQFGEYGGKITAGDNRTYSVLTAPSAPGNGGLGQSGVNSFGVGGLVLVEW